MEINILKRGILLLLFGCMVAGCASTQAYLVDRAKDTEDIFTASVGIGAGARTRVGPVHVGMVQHLWDFGLRGGNFGPSIAGDLELLCIPLGRTKDGRLFFSIDHFEKGGNERGKEFTNVLSTLPFITNKVESECIKEIMVGQKIQTVLRPCNNPAYFTQIEVLAGLGPTLRLGFNPGELVDFFLGWFGIDIFGDDIEIKRLKLESNKSAQRDSQGRRTFDKPGEIEH